MVNEEQHLRDRDEVAQDRQIERIKQAKANAMQWMNLALHNINIGCFETARNQMDQAMKELEAHGH